MIKYDFSWNMTQKLRKQKTIRKFEKTPGQNAGKSVRVGGNTGEEKSWTVFCFCKHRKQKKPRQGRQHRTPPGQKVKAIPHNSKCRYGERGAADAKPKAQIILDAVKVSAASGGNSEPKQGQRSQSARGFCPRSTMRVPQPDIIEYFGNADAVPQLPERCLSRKAGIVRCCLYLFLQLRPPNF